jgi:uncharacterized protein (TIGR03435 family)
MKAFGGFAVLALIPALLPAQTPTFEVADIKPSDPSAQKPGKGRMLPGGRIEVPAQTVRDLMAFAYAMQDDLILGGPKWAAEERFDIIAKASSSVAPDTLRKMMQALLAERFQLTTHTQDKLSPAYVLTVAKTPPAIREGSGGLTRCQWTESGNSLRKRQCTNMTMEEFAKELPDTGGIGIFLPVKDQTDLKGRYDFEFEVGTMRRPGPDTPSDAAAIDDSGPTIFATLMKLGLRLQQQKVMIPAIVIDRLEHPSQK